LVNGFGEARSEARRAKVGGPKGRERGSVFCGGAAVPIPTSWVVWGSAVSSSCSGVRGGAPIAKGFSHILNTQDDLSGQQKYGSLAKRIKHKNE